MKKIYIKNMVCPRCIMAVEDILQKTDIPFIEVRLGEVILEKDIANIKTSELKTRLKNVGFELIDDSNQQIIEQIKTLVIRQIHYPQNDNTTNAKLTELLTSSLHRDYSSISKLFSTVEGITIEQFTILQKTERVKELLAYDQLTLSEIAFKMNYSSVAHLSAQFKKTTGLTPTQFKAQGISLRKGLDKI